MNLISIEFFVFFILVVIIYFLLPGKLQWLWLLISSGFFYFKNANTDQCLVFLAILAVNYLGTMLLSKTEENKQKLVFNTLLILDVLCLVCFKYAAFLIAIINKLLSLFGTALPIDFVVYFDSLAWDFAPPKISYFMLIIIGYVVDVYWGRVEALKNPGKFALLASYFPLMTSGPIIEYENVGDSLLGGSKHRFSYESFIKGAMRVLWGIFKKLVIAERFALIVNTIYGAYETYTGFYIPLAAACFAIQLYTDFSGLMDIVLGLSEILGIALPENFNAPFYSTSLAEFWRRWHITLGGWLKDYVFYAVQRTKLFSKLRKICKKKLGKGYEKKYNIPQFLGLLISWFLIGLWHGGGFNYIFGVGIYMGIVIILSELFSPLFNKLSELCHIKRECFSYRLFQRARTFLLFIFGLSFFRASSLKDGFLMWRSAFLKFNPWIFFDHSLYELGLVRTEFQIAVFGVFLVFLVSYFDQREKERNSGLTVRDLILRQNFLFKLLLFIILFILTIAWGRYGNIFDASSFIYGRF